MVNKSVNIINPEPVKHDWEVARAIERLEEKCRSMMETEGEK